MTTKNILLQKATELFASEGYNGISVRTIAKAAGITEGSIYNHFSSKKEILDEILDTHVKELEEKMPTGQMLIDAYDRPDWKPAWAYQLRFLEAQTINDMNLDIFRILTTEQYRNEKASNIILKYYIDQPIQVTYELFVFLKDRGDTLPEAPMTLARLYQYPLFGLTQEYTIQMSLGNDTAPVIEKMKEHLRLFWITFMNKPFEFL